jgi:hypothetical protein
MGGKSIWYLSFDSGLIYIAKNFPGVLSIFVMRQGKILMIVLTIYKFDPKSTRDLFTSESRNFVNTTFCFFVRYCKRK